MKLEGRKMLPYLAGLFDGEGCISISRSCKGKYVSLNCYVGMAGEFMPRLFQMNFGGAVQHRNHNHSKPNWHDYYRWHIASLKALAFLEAITPYLILKKPQAEIAIAFQKRVSEQKGKTHTISEEEKAVREAELILMKKLKVESYCVN